jgi:hypothetical protein
MGSTRQKGNISENAFCEMIAKHGFCTYPSRGSRGVDVLCVHRETRLCIAVEVGDESKVLKDAFPKLRSASVPVGTWLMVVKRSVQKRRVRWRFYTDVDERHETLDAALEALRAS